MSNSAGGCLLQQCFVIHSILNWVLVIPKSSIPPRKLRKAIEFQLGLSFCGIVPRSGKHYDLKRNLCVARANRIEFKGSTHKYRTNAQVSSFCFILDHQYELYEPKSDMKVRML